jgi:hypothetical protein
VTTEQVSAGGPWADHHAAERVLVAVRRALPGVTHVVFRGPAAAAWLDAAERAALSLTQADRTRTMVVVADPGSLPVGADDVVDFVRSIAGQAAAALLATVSPASTDGAGRWPAFWADPFMQADWAFLDVRPALWDDGRVPLDCKEGLLLFVDQATADVVPSPATAMLHPHRAVELTVAVEARFRALLAQRAEQQALSDSLLRGVAAKHAQLELRLGLLSARLSALQDRLFLVTATPSVPPHSSGWRRLADKVRHRPAPAPPPTPDRSVWELFDPNFYRLQAPDAGDDPLGHYLGGGEREGRRPNPWFDPGFYLEANPDVAAAGMSPFEHYCRFGGYEGRKASPEFDTAHYLAANPDVRAARVHPMLHFLLVGRWEGRAPAPEG